uniref:Uncharacterized protein n=1 Tax=viral metagenome TaxID=1070528 RepID=A0A6C0AF96_9ZZZZ
MTLNFSLNIFNFFEKIKNITTPFQINDEPFGSREPKGTIFLVPLVIHFSDLFI